MSESLNPPEGVWSVMTGESSVVSLGLEDAFVLSRLHSLVATGTGPTAFYVGITFTPNNPVDMTNLQRFAFAIASFSPIDLFNNGDNVAGAGAFVQLVDSVGRAAYGYFGFQTSTTWSPPTEPLWNPKVLVKADFSTPQGFDWANVVNWSIAWSLQRLGNWHGYKVFIDAGPFFTYDVALPTLIVKAQNIGGGPVSGKSLNISNPQGFSQTFALPFGPGEIEPIGTWTLTIIDSDFLRWSDGQTSSTRSFQVAYGGTYTFSAVFPGGPIDGQPPDYTLLIVLGGATTVVGGMALYLVLRKKRRTRTR